MSSTDYVLGVDVGSSAVKAALVDTEGRILGLAEETHRVTRPGPGLAEQSADDWYDAAATAIRHVLTQSEVEPEHIATVAFDGPAHMAALLDADGVEIRPAIHWSDTRAAGEAERLASEMGDLILATTHHRPQPAWTLAQLLWVRDHEPDTWARLHRFAVTKDHVRHRFTGDELTEPYDALGTQLFDASTGTWSEVILDELGWGSRSLPAVRDAFASAGRVTADAARRSGLVVGTPVVVGTSDTLAETYACRVGATSGPLVKLGSSANVLVVRPHPEPGDGRLTYPHLDGQSWIVVTATNSGAATIAWFRAAFMPEHERIAEEEDVPVHRLIERMARSVPAGSDGLLFHPYLNGERSPFSDPGVRGAFTGVDASHGRAHFVRAVMEGVAFSVRHCVERVGLADGSSYVTLIGGGARNDVWCQIVCDVLGLDVTVVSGPAAAYGSATVAARRCGWDVENWNGLELALLSPQPRSASTYDDVMSRYLDVIPSLRGWR